MHSYTVDVAAYDGSTPTPDPNQPQADPWVWIHGTVDGKSAGYLPVQWSQIQRWNAVAGVQGVQNFLAWVLLACITGPPFPPAPALPYIPASIPAPVTGNAKNFSLGTPTSVTCSQALVPAWSA
jgi:hypothetical protein